MTVIDRRYSVAEGTAIKAPVHAATTENITLSGEQTVDAIAVIERDRVLVRSQTTASENGIYEVSTGAWQRAKDCDGAYDLVCGSRVYVTAGGTQGGREFVLTTSDPITIGTTSQTWTASLLVDAAVTAAQAAEALAESAAATAVSAAGSQISFFTTRAAAAATSIPSIASYIVVQGYATVADAPPHRYKKLSAAPSPSYSWQFQSADGAWWELDEKIRRPEYLGAKADTIGGTDGVVTGGNTFATASHTFTSDDVGKYLNVGNSFTPITSISAGKAVVANGTLFSGSTVVNATVTFNAGTDVVTWASHGMSAGDPVSFVTDGVGGTMPTGLTEGHVYHVINPTTNTFQIATTPGGTAINFTSAGTGTLTGGKYTLTALTSGSGLLWWVGTNDTLAIQYCLDMGGDTHLAAGKNYLIQKHDTSKAPIDTSDIFLLNPTLDHTRIFGNTGQLVVGFDCYTNANPTRSGTKAVIGYRKFAVYATSPTVGARLVGVEVHDLWLNGSALNQSTTLISVADEHHGINLINCDNPKATGNRIYNFPGDGLAGGGSNDVHFEDNMVYNCGKANIYVANADGGSDGKAHFVRNYCSGANFDYGFGKILGGDQVSISVNCHRAIITENIVKDSEVGIGVIAEDTGTDVWNNIEIVVADNVVKTMAVKGIEISIEDQASHTVLVPTKVPLIVSNNIVDACNVGLWAQGVMVGNIGRNTITNSTTYGAQLLSKGKDLIFSENIIKESGTAGLYANDGALTRATVERNSFRDNPLAVTISGTQTGLVLRHNTYQGNTIDIDVSTMTLDGGEVDEVINYLYTGSGSSETVASLVIPDLSVVKADMEAQGLTTVTGANQAVFDIRGAFYRASGSLTQGGSTTTLFSYESAVAFDAALSASSNSLVFSVTGPSGGTSYPFLCRVKARVLKAA